MEKRVFLVHGWEGRPDEGWFPWLKRELEATGFTVEIPAMPDAAAPKIDVWVPFLKELVGEVNSDTYFVGHSIGCQTILRFLEGLGKGQEIGGVVLVGGWIHLKPEATEDEGDEDVARPWLETPINWEKINSKCRKFVAIHSDNDPFVFMSDGNVFKEKLGAELVVEHGMKHFSGDDGVTELPSALEAVLRISRS